MTKTDSTINAKRKAKNTSKPTKPKKDDKEKSPNQGASKEQDNKQRPSKMIEKQIKATKTQNKVVGVSQKKNSKTKESKKKSIKKETDSSKEQDNKQRSSKMKVVDASVKKKSKTKGSTIKSSKKETNSRVEQPQPSSKEKAPTTQEERELTQSVVPALLMGAYHLPGYTWRQDLWQYLTNNHPIFGICFHHPLHPVSRNMRLTGFIGSAMFGLAITNVIYLAFVFTDEDPDQKIVIINAANFTTNNQFVNDNVSNLQATTGNIALWTIGGMLHGCYDNTIWSLAAAIGSASDSNAATESTGSERIRKFKRTLKAFLIILSVVIAIALATFAAALRAALDSQDVTVTELKTNGLNGETKEILSTTIDGSSDMEFLIAYIIELAMTFFVWYPLIGTVLFSGILGCGKYPIIGGRPYDLMLEQQPEKERLDQEDGIETQRDIETGTS